MNRTVKITLISIASLIGVSAAIFVLCFMPGSTAKMEQIAGQFKPDPSWKFKSETVKPPRIICLDGHCDELDRSWKLAKNISTEEFKNVLERSGWGDFTGDTECNAHENIRGSGETLCSVSGFRGEYHVQLDATGSFNDDSNAKIILSIRALDNIE